MQIAYKPELSKKQAAHGGDARPDMAAPRTRAISIPLTEKAFQAIEREAKARSVSVDKLALASLADFLGRGAKTGAARRQPLVLHLPGRLRGVIVNAAKAEGKTVNRFVVEGMAERLGFKFVVHGQAVNEGGSDEA